MPIEITALGIDFGNATTTIIGVEDAGLGTPKFHLFSHTVNGVLKYYFDSVLASRTYPADISTDDLIPFLDRNDILIEEAEEEVATKPTDAPKLRLDRFDTHILDNPNADFGKALVHSFFQQIFNELWNQSTYVFRPTHICYNLPIYPHVAERKIYDAAVRGALADIFKLKKEQIYPASAALLSTVAYARVAQVEEGTPILTVDCGGKTTGIAVARAHYKNGELCLDAGDTLPPYSIEGSSTSIGLALTRAIYQNVRQMSALTGDACLTWQQAERAKCELLAALTPAAAWGGDEIRVPITGAICLTCNVPERSQNAYDVSNYVKSILDIEEHVTNYIAELQDLRAFLGGNTPILLLTGGSSCAKLLRDTVEGAVRAALGDVDTECFLASANFPGLAPVEVPAYKIAAAYGAAYVAYKKKESTANMQGIDVGTGTRELYSIEQQIKESRRNTKKLAKATETLKRRLQEIIKAHKLPPKATAAEEAKMLEALRQELIGLLSSEEFFAHLEENGDTDDTDR